MGSLIEWLLNTCQNLKRLSISEGGNDRFRKQNLDLIQDKTSLTTMVFMSVAVNSNLIKTSGV